MPPVFPIQVDTIPTVIYHRADWDGKASAAVCYHALKGRCRLVGWDYTDPLLKEPSGIGPIYIVDLSPSCLCWPDHRSVEAAKLLERIVWIDHHKSSIEYFENIAVFKGIRMDGVAACRLCEQWFKCLENGGPFPHKEQFLQRDIHENHAIRMIGEYDVWDHRERECIEFQYYLDRKDFDIKELSKFLFDTAHVGYGECCYYGRHMYEWHKQFAKSIAKTSVYYINISGVKIAVLNSAHAINSRWFPVEELDHDALAVMSWRVLSPTMVKVSLYDLDNRCKAQDIDLSNIAKLNGGGGHKYACGWELHPSRLSTLIWPGEQLQG